MKKALFIIVCLLSAMLFFTVKAAAGEDHGTADAESESSYDELLDKAAAYAKEGDFTKAMACYDLALRTDPERTDAYISAGQLCLDFMDHEGALSYAEQVLALRPSLPEGWLLKCRADLTAKDLEQFGKDSVYAEICGADLHPYAADIGILYAENGRYEDAVYYFAMADLNSLDDAAKSQYRSALLALGKRDQAAELGLMNTVWYDPELDARFSEDRLIMADTKFAGLELSADAFVFSEESLRAMDLTENEEELFGELEEGLKELREAPDQAPDPVISLSPRGDSGLILAGNVMFAYYHGEYRMIYPSEKRGTDDIYGNLEFCYNFLVSSQSHPLIGKEGVVYSPDGRYAAAFNAQRILSQGNGRTDPVIIDLSTGEMILTATYANSFKDEGFGMAVTAAFSSDGRYFYYLLYGNFENGRSALYRYDLESEVTELCRVYEYDEAHDVDYRLYYPHLEELPDGSFIVLNDSVKIEDVTGIVRTSFENGEWIVEQQEHTLPLRMFYPKRLDYSANSGYAVMSGAYMNTQRPSYALQVFLPEEAFKGMDRYICMDKDTDTAKVLNADEYTEQMNDLTGLADGSAGTVYYEPAYQYIVNTVLSPDGRYLLLLTRVPERNETRLLLMRLSDLTVKPLQGIETDQIMFVGNMEYMEWNTDQLIIRMNDGLHSYSFKE